MVLGPTWYIATSELTQAPLDTAPDLELIQISLFLASDEAVGGGGNLTVVMAFGDVH